MPTAPVLLYIAYNFYVKDMDPFMFHVETGTLNHPAKAFSNLNLALILSS